MSKIQKMFAEMGLGSDKEREGFQQPPQLAPEKKDQPQIFIRLSNRTDDSQKD